MKPYETFWQWLPLALTVAEIRHPGAGKAIAAIRRLKVIEGLETGSGQTGYLNNNDPYKALDEFVAHIYDGAPAPFWLLSAERG